VALAGGSGEGARPAAGHAIVVEQPYEHSAQQIMFTGSLGGKAWSRTYTSHCVGTYVPEGATVISVTPVTGTNS
jgi:hypothetical protein